MLFYEVDIISKDCTESKGNICYIILKLMKFQVDANSCLQCLHASWFMYR